MIQTEAKTLSKYSEEEIKFVQNFLTDKRYFSRGILTLPPKELTHFWQSIDTNPLLSVLFYVELVKQVIEVVKKGYIKHLYILKRAINTVTVLTHMSKLEELGINSTFRGLQSLLKKLSADLLNEFLTNDRQITMENSVYLIKEINLAIELGYEPDSNQLIRVICNIPLKFENISIDYYKHVEKYRHFSSFAECSDSGDMVFLFNIFQENYEEVDPEFFFKVASF